jgi:hypothetical protein
MGEQTGPVRAARRILVRAEHDVLTYRECAGPQDARRIRRPLIGVNAHAAEIVPESGLKVGSRSWVKRLPRQREHLMHDARCLAGGRLRPCLLPWRVILILAIFAFAADMWRRKCKGDSRIRHAQDLVRDAIRFVLQRVVDGADVEFRLNGETSSCKRRRQLQPFGMAREKDGDLGEIPQRRGPSGGHPFGIILIFARAGLIAGHPRPLIRKLQSRPARPLSGDRR